MAHSAEVHEKGYAMMRANLPENKMSMEMPGSSGNDDDNVAKQKLEAAIALHEGHMNGSVPVKKDSQEQLMSLLKEAYAALSVNEDENEMSATTSNFDPVLKETYMPAVSQAQRRFMGAELARKKKGKKTRTKMSRSQLAEFARTKEEGLPERKSPMHALRGRMKKKR